MHLTARTSVVLLLTTFSHAALAQRAFDQDERRLQMRDYGQTLSRADAARLAGDYQQAAEELAGYLRRWQDHGLLNVDESEQLQGQMRRYVELRETLERSATDDRAAAAFLRLVVTHTDPSARTVEQVRALAILAQHHPRLHELFGRVFPARLVVSVQTPAGFPPDHNEILLQNALVDLTRDQPLRLFADDGRETMSVVVTVIENDRKNSLLEGTSMKSWAVHVVAELNDENGERVLRSATTTAILGINPGNAGTYGMARVADRTCAAVIDELARGVDRSLTR
jgi:hypothetical protein